MGVLNQLGLNPYNDSVSLNLNGSGHLYECQDSLDCLNLGIGMILP